MNVRSDLGLHAVACQQSQGSKGGTELPSPTYVVLGNDMNRASGLAGGR